MQFAQIAGLPGKAREAEVTQDGATDALERGRAQLAARGGRDVPERCCGTVPNPGSSPVRILRNSSSARFRRS